MEIRDKLNLSFEIKLLFTVFGRIISDGRRSPSQVMADSANTNNLVQNRVIKSRRNTREERLKQQKALKT